MEKIKKTWTNLISSTANLVLAGYKIKVALFELSKRCPYSCKYCYTESGPAGKVIPLPVAEKIIKQLRSEDWLVRTFVNEIVPEIEPFFPLMRKLKVRDINSAGDPLVLHPEWFDQFKTHKIDTIRVTVFPTEELHFEWTRRKRQMAIQAIRLALEQDFRVTWNFLLSRQTRPYLAKQIEEAKRVGVSEFNVNNFFPAGRGAQLHSQMLTAEELLEVTKEYYKLRQKCTPAELTLTRTGMLGPNTVDPESTSAKLAAQGKYCYAGTGSHGEMIFIDVHQNVFGCMTHQFLNLPLGTISNEGKLLLTGTTPLDTFHRKNCFTMYFLQEKYKK